jgi:hypothetical protein
MDGEESTNDAARIGDEGILITHSVELEETSRSTTSLADDEEKKSWDRRAREMQEAYLMRIRDGPGTSEEELV